MDPKQRASAGTFESSDILVLIEPAGAGTGRNVELDSIVIRQYGEDIRKEIDRVLDRYEVVDIKLIAKDKGALAPTIAARVETALRRSLGIQEGTGYEAE